MASSKDHSSEGEIDPLVSIHAEKVLVGVRLMLSVHNYKSSCHCGHRYHSKEQIGPVKAGSLLLEKFLVVVQPVVADRRHLFEVNQVIVSLEPQVINLVNEHNECDCYEIEWVNSFIARWHPEAHDKKHYSGSMHDRTIDLVEDQSLALGPIGLLFISQTRVEYETESEEEGVLREQVNQEDPMDVTMSEFVDRQVENHEGL